MPPLFPHLRSGTRNVFCQGWSPTDDDNEEEEEGEGRRKRKERKEASMCRTECPGRKGLLGLEGILQLTLTYDCLCLGVEWVGQRCRGSASWTYSFFYTITNYLNLKVSLCGFAD